MRQASSDASKHRCRAQARRQPQAIQRTRSKDGSSASRSRWNLGYSIQRVTQPSRVLRLPREGRDSHIYLQP